VAQASHGITLPVYVRSEINSWEDLRGKPLAVDAVDTAYALVLRRILLAHGLEMERGDYTLEPKGTTGFRLDSMTQGEAFAAIVNPPWDKKAEAAGHKRFADHSEVLPDYPGGVFAVDRKWSTAKPGCATNLWVNFSLRHPIFPKLLPSAADLAATQGDNRVGASDSPPHA
jgi:ABC-type nitrate/sulfonate/bicarbonate transport system substrate-binding protein